MHSPVAVAEALAVAGLRGWNEARARQEAERMADWLACWEARALRAEAALAMSRRTVEDQAAMLQDLDEECRRLTQEVITLRRRAGTAAQGA